ncbi:SAC3/GANP family domain-containing protein [Ditylenchus destructor]|nr:SAC3/GANP family domain-containing protein [Ditylenchus destructor]
MDAYGNGSHDIKNSSGIHTIPMPGSEENSASEAMDTNESQSLNESWQRAQRALSSIGQTTRTPSTQPQQPYGGAYPPPFGMPYAYGLPPPVYMPPYYNAALSAGYSPQTFMPYSYPSASTGGAQQMGGAPRQFNPQRFGLPPIRIAQRPPQPVPFTREQNKVLQRNAPGIKPIRFVISSNAQTSNAISTGAYPDAVKEYIERAYGAVETPEDKRKLENYLKERVEPLMKSGAINAVNWGKEPLPHEVNFTIQAKWTPVSSIKKQYQSPSGKTTGSSPSNTSMTSPERARDCSTGSWFRTSSPEIEILSPERQTDGNRSGKGSATRNKKEIPLSKKQMKKRLKQQQQYVPFNVSPAIPFSTSSGGSKKAPKWSVVDMPDKKDLRARRFEQDNKRHRTRGFAQQRPELYSNGNAVHTRDSGDIVGTCMEVEKQFFRLTAAADPSQIRPLSILVEALGLVKEKYRQSSDYRYASDQLKSIRQDLMIQNIRNEFTVLVYESNARVCLENKDREEFNQCQNQLKLLYKEVNNCPNRWEFTSYRLLYYIYMNNTLDVSTLLDELMPDALKDQCMNFALSVWDSWSMGNYVRLFRLYTTAPRMTGYVIDWFVDRERRKFCTSILKAYRPEISVSVVAKWLGMDEKELIDWLSEKGIQTNTDGTVDCRQHANTQL